jgi:hypothetical protein
MGNKVNTRNVTKPFFRGYEMLPGKYQRSVKKKIMYECGILEATFYRKASGLSVIRPPELKIIESAFKKHGIDPWTGEKKSKSVA